MTQPTVWALSRFGIVLCKQEVINRHVGDPYLWRFTIFKCRWFGAMLHRFLSSDDECVHDHPWPFVSIVLSGGYWEYDRNLVRRWYRPGSFLFRRSSWAHRIEIDPGRRNVWTLVLTGPRCREWGFFTRFGWLPWRRYRYAEHCS